MVDIAAWRDMEDKPINEEDWPPESIDCCADSCRFPKTCRWNLRCMQRGLTLSMREKERMKPMDAEDGNQVQPGRD